MMATVANARPCMPPPPPPPYTDMATSRDTLKLTSIESTMKNNNGNEKRSARSNDNSRRTSVSREVNENAAMGATTNPSPSTEQHIMPVLERGSQQENGVTRRCYPIPTEILPGAEAVRGPEYNEEDEEGTVIIGERSEIVESDEIISAHLVGVNMDLQPPKSLLPESPPLYGREEELKQLGEVLGMGGRMAALIGGAGMGKTHCASHFAQQWLREDVAHRFVLWLESDTENVVRVSYLRALENVFGEEVPDSEEEMSMRDLARLLWQALGKASTQFEWLVVYNNVPEVLGDSEGPDAFSPLFFPTPLQDWGRGRILLTTRCTSYGGRIRDLGNHHVEMILVEPLDESTAVTMLMNNLDDASAFDSERDAAKETVELFGYLPLAIVTANSQITSETLTVSEYLSDLKAGLAENDVHDAVSLALANALVYAQNHGLGDVLEVAAFLSPDQLTLELLGCDRKMARHLCRLSLLRHSGNDVYMMHRLHQEVAREGASPLKAIAATNQAMTRFDPTNSDTWHVGISMMSHLDSLEKNVETLARKGSVLKSTDFALLLDNKAQVMHFVLHNYEQACSYYQQSLEMKQHVYGPEAKNHDLARTLDNIGTLERKLGNYDKARMHYEESLGKKQHVHNYDKARMHYEESLEMKRQIYGSETKNADLAATLDNLGILELELGNYDKARTYYEQSLEIKRHVHGPDAKCTDLVTTLSNLATIEKVLGSYEKALLHLEEALEMERQVSGSEARSAYFAVALGDLGNLEQELGNYDKARMRHEQSLEILGRVYGPETKNAELAETLCNLGDLEREIGNYDKSRLLLEASLDMFGHVYGPKAKNTDLATVLFNLGNLERELANYDQAHTHYKEAWEMQRHVYGPEAKNTKLAETLNSLGNLERDLGNYVKARWYYEESFEMKRHVYGPDVKNTALASALNNLGALESDLDNYEKAHMNYEEALEIQRHVYGPEAKNVDLAMTLNNLGLAETELGNYDESRLHLEESLSMLRLVHGSEARHANLSATLDSLGTLEKALGNHDAARVKYSEALDMAMDGLGKDASGNHPLVEEIRRNLADIG